MMNDEAKAILENPEMYRSETVAAARLAAQAYEQSVPR